MGQPLLITREHLRHRTPKNQIGEQRLGQASPRVCVPSQARRAHFLGDLRAVEGVPLPPAGSLLTSAGAGQQPGPEGFTQLCLDASCIWPDPGPIRSLSTATKN